MALANKISSNVVGLRYAEEASPNTLPVSPTWYPLEPNSFQDFGGDLTTIARNPINDSRQRKFGVVTDLSSGGGFMSDLTQKNLADLMQGFMFASYRTKHEKASTATSTTAYTVATGTDYVAGDLLFAKGFDAAANNGLKLVTASASTSVTVGGLSSSTTQTGTVSRVGYQFASGDLEVDVTAGVTSLLSTTKDFTTLGLIPGEYIFIGGDTSATQFATAGNKGFARIRSVAAHAIVLDKTDAAFTTDDGAGKTVRVFFGRVLKNESGTNIVRRTYQLEMTLGAPDLAQPSQIQSQYLTGASANQLELMVPTANKVEATLSFVGRDFELRTGANGVKSGTRPTLEDASAFNTSSDVPRYRLALVDETTTAPVPMFAYATDMRLTVNNNVQPNKAISVLGAFDATEGQFEVSAALTVYFRDVEALQAARDNSAVTFDFSLVKENAGITFDMPTCSLGGTRPQVAQGEAIRMNAQLTASSGSYVASSLDHTLLLVFWDYLPDLAG